ncbi:MAG: TauD/TfdA family dioxygenase, partial [Gammaproteobacteria bacterium]|nr:TauD/TfdA family dioxygenase [Gammaproteobacteria bacterium]
YPMSVADLVVEIDNPLALTASEKASILERCQKMNMAVYQLKNPSGDPADKDPIKKLGEQMGLARLDSNLCADNDSITSLKVVADGRHQTYIPYSTYKISWHTDGYYNSLDHQIHGLFLHCVTPAMKGGENALMDHEIAYIHLRDTNPDYIHALMQPDAMTIPANEENGSVIRNEQTGPVFSVDPTDGHLHMRYTARTRSIVWKNDNMTKKAAACLSEFLNSDSEFIFRHTLQSGQGLISNNVLHDRTAFEDSDNEADKRLLYRARYFDRIANT